MNSIPYIEYTKLEGETINSDQWYYMSHLSNACASEGAHRTSAYAICLLSEGSLQLETDLFVQIAHAPAIFTIGPSTIRKFTDLGTTYDAKIFFFRKEIFLEGQADINYLDKFDFFEKTGQQVMPLDSNKFLQFKSYFDVIHQKSREASPNTSAIIQSLIYIVLNEIDDVHHSLKKEVPTSVDKKIHILSQFKTLLSENFLEERQISFYADKLHLTPKYFSTVIKEASDKTAGAWINEMLILESKVRLQNKERSIAQIAYDLDFSDPSHFGKFFKKHVGISPLEYRS
ncbi:helix-turn-helix domain-containing protein [Albibacterium sp.]|uniref:helix-turn-helix domain-containing protein n=1 Tax=Albibacterium sp. TaxID=2952885 RepID=UPI002CE1D313|nr:helix-turn-helix domain-containing protein [Albibacterium sp.]HUH18616.1 helix-turn-helix domain-containing protein [Albibacterium sp.]